MLVSMELRKSLLAISTPFSPSRTSSATSYQLTKNSTLSKSGFAVSDGTFSINTIAGIATRADSNRMASCLLLFILASPCPWVRLSMTSRPRHIAISISSCVSYVSGHGASSHKDCTHECPLIRIFPGYSVLLFREE